MLVLRTWRITFLATFIILASVVEVSAFPPANRLAVPENYEVRLRYRDLIFGARNGILDFGQVVEDQKGSNQTVSMQVLNQNDSFYLVFTNEEAGEFPLYSRGSYIIRRDFEDGAFTQIKIFTRSDPGSFIRIHPSGRRSSMDVFLFGRQLYKRVILPISIERLVVEPFSNIVAMTSSQVNWELLSQIPARPEDKILTAMVKNLRSSIADLADSDDGAIDQDGTYRFIESLAENPEKGLNCSGFAKWVIDGLYQRQTGELLPIESLKRKHVSLRGTAWSENYENERDPYFGLDWSRNLATAILSLEAGGGVDPEAADVRSVPFFDYIEDVGYSVQDIELVLYFLTRVEPGHFYIGSINRDFGEDPVLKQHVHLVLLFPYFDESGAFDIAVFERNIETSTASLMTRYPGDHIHLVQVPAPESYSPPTLNFDTY